MIPKPSSLNTLVTNAVLVLGLIIIWFAFAPTKIGGNSSYVIIQGNSMEPVLYRGDLAIIRNTNSYSIGDIATYWDANISTFVIHRITDINGVEFTFKGDNNSWIDPIQPTEKALIGTLWFHIPKAGKLMEWLRTPINFALIIILLGGFFMASFFIKPGKKQVTQIKPVRSIEIKDMTLNKLAEISLYVVGAMFLFFIGLLIYALSQPTSIPVNDILYQHQGHFTYSAAGSPGVYDGDIVQPGEPIFTNFTCQLNVEFSYYLTGSQLNAISGSHQLYAHIIEEQSGWQRTLPMSQKTSFTGNTFVNTNTVDLCEVSALVRAMEESTGLYAALYKMEIVAPVAISGEVAGQVISDTFSPVLIFGFDEVHFYLDANSNTHTGDAFLFSQPGLDSNQNMKENKLSLFGFQPTVKAVRVFSILELGFSLVIIVFSGMYLYIESQKDELLLTQLKYRNLLVEVQGNSFEPRSPVIDVDSIDTLAKLAERHNTMILHISRTYLHDYLVQEANIVYRFSLHIRTKNNELTKLPNEQFPLGEAYLPTPMLSTQQKHTPYANAQHTLENTQPTKAQLPPYKNQLIYGNSHNQNKNR